MKKINTLTLISVILLYTTTVMFAFSIPRATYPKNFIPFWSQPRGGHETTLLNTAQIVRIVPVFDPNEEEPNHKDIQHLEVYMTDGKVLTVNENFAEFYQRVRVSQAK